MKDKRLFYSMVFLTAILIQCSHGENQIKSPTPNIIYILADDLGYGDLGCYGQEEIETPNIDALANNGILFTQHYSSAPVCAPARCMLLTGLHSGHAQIRSNDPAEERGDVWDFEAMFNDPNLEGSRPLKPGTQTIGTLLQGIGYKTAIVGKWGLGGPLTEGIPNKQGFDFFYGYNCQRQAHTYFPLHLWKNTEKVLLNNKMVPPRKSSLPEGSDPYNLESYSDFWLTDYSPELMQNELIQFININKDKPFFVYYATTIPHLPLQAPKKWIDYYVKKFGDEEPFIGSVGNYFPQRYPHACYAAMISYFDEKVGELVTTLKKLGLYENTLIMFSSDNGPIGQMSTRFKSAGPFHPKYVKGRLQEGGIRIPMVAQWPGKIKARTESDLFSAHYDVLPTICELVGIESYGNIDGISFLPTLLGKGEQKKHDFLYWEIASNGGQQTVRLDKWKGIRKNIFQNGLSVQLYNLEDDIQELNDISAQHPVIVEKIETIFGQEHIPAEIESFKIKQLGD